MADEDSELRAFNDYGIDEVTPLASISRRTPPTGCFNGYRAGFLKLTRYRTRGILRNSIMTGRMPSL
jgi:hypothetical protein